MPKEDQTKPDSTKAPSAHGAELGGLPVRNFPSLRKNPRPDTSRVTRIDAIGWVSSHAICGVPEAARIEEEIRRLQQLAKRHGAAKEEIYLPNFGGQGHLPAEVEAATKGGVTGG